MGESVRRSRNARAERERLEAEAEYYRAQTEAVRNQGARQTPSTAAQPPEYLTAWLRAAQPRMGLYPDFEQKVFAPEVNITPDMVRLMTSSPLAADISYYLATHRAETTAISQLPLLEAARAIDRIESELRTTGPVSDRLPER
ncbi:hypothetical protein N0B51_09575 [Tsuneonella sp. YG55]|uniref:Uncharacterized protein n=1 Tax=Tsuneonella litorea TaxID=2976475 RepID=A0A9X3ALF6_9SPHN|nr:hypothetical protein [Tsuneonella litorea]MCT2559233.1 hypothetical protein [Tsuneonella litorea]